LASIIHDTRVALRSLTKRPGLIWGTAFTLAVAVGANTALFSVLNGVVLQPLPYEAPDQLVMIWESNPSQGLDQEPTSEATFLDWRSQARTFQSMAAFRYRGFTLLQENNPQRLASVLVTPSIFDVLRVQPVLGRRFLPEEEAPGNERIVILSDRAWRARFGADPRILGQTITLDGEPYEVVGVMEQGFSFPVGDDEVEAWSPLTIGLPEVADRPHRMYSTIGRLADGATLDGARREIDGVARRIARDYPESNQGWGVSLVRAEDQLLGDTSRVVWILFGAVSLVLLMGCANVSNLLLIRSGERSGQAAVRAAFGASPRDLVRQLLAEGVVIGVLGGAAGIFVTFVAVGGLRRLLPAGFPRVDEIELDPVVLVFSVAVGLLAGLISSLPPALQSMRPDLVRTLVDAGRGASLGKRWKNVSSALISAEVALALVLMLGAALLLQTYSRLASVDPGYRTDSVLAVAVELSPARYGTMVEQRTFFTDLMTRVRQLPGVEAVGAVSYLPMSPIGLEFDIPFTVEGLDASSPSQRPTAEYRGVFPGYFDAMDIEIVAGRALNDLDGTDGHGVALVNQTLVQRYFSERDPVGQTIEMPMLGQVEVVGVVEDIRHDGIGVEANPELFVPFVQLPMASMHIVAHTPGNADVVAGLIRSAVLAIDPQQTISKVNLLSDLVSDSIAPPRFNMILVLGLACCAVLLALVGVHGVVSYAVSSRAYEIAIRMALGLNSWSAVWLALAQAGKVIVGGVVAGLALASAMVPALGALLYEVEPFDLPTFLGATMGLTLVALVSAAVPAIRAARVDPAVALRR